jgi:SH3 domain-containing YSC84-like protein 1
VLHEIIGMPDKGIPEEVLQHAKCVAVIPHMVKGGFVFGAEGGKGVATCRTADGWSAPAFITISGGSWGLQIGVEAVDVVMIFQNDKAMQRLLESNFQVGGDASAAAGPVGRHAEAGTDWKMDTEILTYSRAKGAVRWAHVEGASLRQDKDSRDAIYGRNVTTRALLLGQVPAPAVARAIPSGSSRSKSSGQSQQRVKLLDSSSAVVCQQQAPALFERAQNPSFVVLSVRANRFSCERFWIRLTFRCLRMSTGGQHGLDHFRCSSSFVAFGFQSAFRRSPDPPAACCGVGGSDH